MVVVALRLSIAQNTASANRVDIGERRDEVQLSDLIVLHKVNSLIGLYHDFGSRQQIHEREVHAGAIKISS
jgi:hypothetical protein